MNLVLPPQKIQLSSWDDFIKHADKRQKRVIRFFAPLGIKYGALTPQMMTDAILLDIVAKLTTEDVVDYFKQPDAKPHTKANSFIRAIRDIAHDHDVALPALSEFPAVNATARAPKTRFVTTFGPELDAFFKIYRIPDTYLEADGGSLAPTAALIEKIGAPISSGGRSKITNGLHNAYQAACAGPGAPSTLTELHREPCLEAIIIAAKADQKRGRAIEMLHAVAQIAAKDANLEARNALNAEASQIHARRGGNAVSGDLLRRLQPFNDLKAFHAFGQRLVHITLDQTHADLATLHGLTRATAALGALLAITAPATFEVINGMTFSGPEYKERPELWSKKDGRLEEPLNPLVRERITAFYFAFFEAYGVYPKSIFAGKDGEPRTGGTTSVNTLLKNLDKDVPPPARLNVDLAASELRDLGVYRMAWGNDTDETMAKAARVSAKYFGEHFGPMVAFVKDAKRKKR